MNTNVETPSKLSPRGRWLRRSLFVLASAVLAGAGALLWLLHTTSGLRLALYFAPASLRVGQVEGTLAGPMVLKNLHYQDPAATVQLQSLTLDFDWLPLLRKHVLIRELKLEGLNVQQPEVAPVQAVADTPSGGIGWTIELQKFSLATGKFSRGSEDLAVLLSADAGKVLFSEGALHFERLRFDETRGSLQADGVLDLRAGHPSDLRVGALLREPAMTAAAHVLGDVKKLNLDVELLTPQPASFHGELTDLLSELHWTGDLKVPELSLKTLGVKGPIDLVQADLQASGNLTSATLAGEFALDAQHFGLTRSAVTWGEVLVVDAFELVLPNSGKLSAAGQWPLLASAPPGALTLEWQKLALPSAWGWPEGLSSASGKVLLTGHPEAYGLAAQLAVARATLAADLDLQVSGTPERLQIANAKVRTESGSMDLQGEIELGKEPSWKLELAADQLNPALFTADWPGAVRLKASSAGRLLETGPEATLQISELAGTLRTVPISGSGDLRFAGKWQPLGKLDLQWGSNQVAFNANQAGAVQGSLDLRQLALLVPEAKGTLEGEVSARFDEGLQSLQGVVRGRLLDLGAVRFETLDMDFALSPELEAPLKLQLAAHNGAVTGEVLDSLSIAVAGTRSNHKAELQLSAPLGRLNLSAGGGEYQSAENQGGWRGTLAQLQLVPGKGRAGPFADKPITLEAPVQLEVSAQSARWSRTCLRGEALNLCSQGQWAKLGPGEIQLSELEFPLELVNGELAAKGLELAGKLRGGGQFTLRDGALTSGELKLDAPEAVQVKIEVDQQEYKTLKLNPLGLSVGLHEGQPMLLNAQVTIQDAGSIALRELALGDALAGEIALEFKNLAVFDGFSESLVKPSGSLRGQLTLSGTRALPGLNGTLQISALAAELPEYGLALREGALNLQGTGERLAVEGSVRSGTGVLKVSGWLAPFAKAKAELKLSGSQVLVIDVPRARVVASPELTFSHDGELLRLKGEVTLPSASVRLDRFESSVVVSNDVVIVDDAPIEAGLPVHADLVVIMGSDVNLQGFGLDGKLAGRLSIRERPNRASTARGEIEVSGTYKAYGQDLKIERGKLLFSSSRLDDPGLDIRAVRVVEKFKVGVLVRGTALNPQLNVWSDPVLEQSEALSYIVLGRSLRGASGADSALVGQAANALGAAGGNFLARGLGQKVGLELGVETLSDVGGPAFTAGKYLSPSLYIGYGQGLFTPQTVFIVRYKLFGRYEIEAISGRELKIGVNYRIER